ncbi:u3 small nucleolar rna-associated 5 [Fusarium longipes]|uniref:U3 small nucleolar rna-associated 5 n=1 Tax=Fusarium longipes TaxID=694270 RepID=A0A395RIS8_9HYPO|nr:u3 small nucleolar rna-associated 5 [Fusarium longipes]
MSTTKRKTPVKLAAPVSRTSARIPNKSVVDESMASIAGPDAYGSQVETIEISSDADSDEDLSDAESLNEQQEQQQSTEETSSAKILKKKVDDEVNEEEEDAEGTSPSFGELLRAENDIIDVPSALNGAIASHPTRNAIVPPSHKSLGTVLTQALRTDDTDLLESCLHTTDAGTVHNTIERLDSALAGILLTKLAARLYRRPGRAGNLTVWVNWTLIAHGGALASQPKVLQSLSGLQKVLSERAKGLSSLLALKGKLEMLDSQMKLRRRMYSGSLQNTGESDSDSDEDVIWVEGEDEAARTPGRRRALEGDFDESDDDADVPIANGFVGDSDDEEESAGEEVDSDAEESLDEDEVDHDDVDESMGEDEESDVEATAAPPSKLQKTAGNFSKRR